MTFEPLFELWTSVILLGPPILLVAWTLFRARTWRARWSPIRRLGILALLVLAACGPAVPGALTKVVVSDIDVFLAWRAKL